MMFRLFAGLMALALPVCVSLPASAQEKVLRAVMHADVRVIDPIWTTQTIANIHGALIYDTLFGNDADQKPQPQMVGKYDISPDRMVYTFTLRDGLKFHDGSPVTTKDVIASLKRWGAKDGVGQRLMGYVTSMTPADDRTFTMVLREPYGMVLESLGKSGSSIAAIMREKDALTDPQQQVKESVGSGPFTFAKDLWVPGSKAVYLKNKDYVPRTEAPSSFAGGKIPGVDRIELVWISDPQTAMSALINGEIDLYEAPNNDFLPLLEKARGVKLLKTGK
ncbi:MAG: ABC transporter substrate-binding protein, partial [Alphaproteobacteria bacterium]|nr:ABC transporter substrate-binding protein [Alphaproteobacteria bacterium]